MKFIYVLVSTNSDIYTEQAFVSITSLRMHNENAFVSLLTDDKTDKNLDERNFKLKELVNEVTAINFEEALGQRERSRQLKTRMRNLVSGDFLFIDCDTIICESLESISECRHNLAAVPDTHIEFKNSMGYISVCEMFKKADKRAIPIKKFHFNSGVLFARECEESAEFFNKWNEFWNLYTKKNIYKDQISFAFANMELKFPIAELSGIWNCQMQYGMNYLANAKILHYFATVGFEYGRFKKQIPMSLKETGALTENDLSEIKKPKQGFPIPHLVVSGSDYKFFYYFRLLNFYLKKIKAFFTPHPK